MSCQGPLAPWRESAGEERVRDTRERARGQEVRRGSGRDEPPFFFWTAGRTGAAIVGMDHEVYVSTDIEADGPIPGPHSMLSLGAAAYDESGRLLDTFSVNLQTLDGAVPHPETTSWWEGHQDAYLETRKDTVPPADAMLSFENWLKSLPGPPVFVAWPAGFDFTFVYWYLRRFLDRSPLSFAALDLKTYAMALRDLRFRGTMKRRLPERWFGPGREGHIALNDALDQGEMWVSMLRDRRAWPSLEGALLQRASSPEEGLAFRRVADSFQVCLLLDGLTFVKRKPFDRDEIAALAKTLARLASSREGEETIEVEGMVHGLARRAVGETAIRLELRDPERPRDRLEVEWSIDPRSIGGCAEALRRLCAEDRSPSEPHWD